MPNDLVSREAVMAAIGKMKDIGGLARIAVKSVIAEVPAALPDAGDERWEKLAAFIEIYRPSCGDTEYAIGLQNACDAIDNAMDRLSPPPQEAGDEPGI